LASARELAADYVVVEIDIPDNIPIEILQERDVPPDWNADGIPNRHES
jgi:hypothetical protein